MADTPEFSIGGTLEGLVGSGLVLRNYGGDDLAVASDGAFVFAKRAPTGGAYAVTILKQPTGPAQTCELTGANGTMADAFGSGPSEIGVHPTVSEWKGQTYTSPRHHQIAFMCADLDATMADLASRGARFAGEVSRAEYGASVLLVVPGADPVMLYQPTHPTAYQRTR